MAALEISRLDDKMLAMADSRSPKEISQALGGVITPTRVAARIKELLETRDWLTDAQQDQMVSLKMRKLLGKVEDQFFTEDNAKVQLATLKAIGERLDKRRAATAVDLNTLYSNQAQIMLRAIDIATGYLRGAFREQIEQEEWDAAIREGMSLAAAELEKHEAVNK